MKSERKESGTAPKPRPRFRHPVGPKLRKVLWLVFGLCALIGVNSVYLVSIRLLEWRTGQVYQDLFHQYMFLMHLLVGLLIIVPVILFGILHMRNTWNRPNRRAVVAGYSLFAASLVLLGSGVVLTRIEGVFDLVSSVTGRSIVYWVHVLVPCVVVYLYLLHRLAGRRIKWRIGVGWAAVAGVFAVIMLVVKVQDPRDWNVVGPEEGEQYFFPSLARTSTGNFIDAKILKNDEYCLECHQEVHKSWAHSVHKWSSFNNPPYLFSVTQTRKAMMERDGNVQGARFCAGCHDPVPFFSGAFDDPRFDDPNYDLSSDVTAQAGVTCTVCHAISHVNSVRGNADYTIDEPIHYPFAFSENPMLKWINRQLIKAKPEFHKATFLKPLHQTTEFCSTCHKVHLPAELNAYKWLRGQNHHDSFWLSGVSGQGITSFYYPPKAEQNCNGCHMPLVEVAHGGDDVNFSARVRDDSDVLKTLDHQFPSANTAIPHLVRDQLADADGAIENHREFLEGVMRVDIFGIREEGRIDGELHAPLRPSVPSLVPGETYLLETVIRTVKMGHLFTQGTADSNEVWMDVTVRQGDRVIGRSGGRDPEDNSVDPWSHYVNAFVIDREGNRINRRNAEDIFVALYNNQIPPGAADVIHYRLDVPSDLTGSITVDVHLQFRKFDTEYMQFVEDDPATEGLDPYYNDLPITTLASDSITFQLADAVQDTTAEEREIPEWQRWNDFGIALFRAGQFRQAERAFSRVEELGRPNGPVNLARVYLADGRVDREAPDALRRARDFKELYDTDLEAREWSVLWFSALVAKANGQLDDAIRNMNQIIEGGFRQAQGRNFDFSKDYRVQNELADTLYKRGLRERGDDKAEARERFMKAAEHHYLTTLGYDPENAVAHYGLNRVYEELGMGERAEYHGALHDKYKVDDNARDVAIAAARQKYPAANVAAEAVVIYDLHRDGAYELTGPGAAEEQDVEVAHHGSNTTE